MEISVDESLKEICDPCLVRNKYYKGDIVGRINQSGDGELMFIATFFNSLKNNYFY